MKYTHTKVLSAASQSVTSAAAVKQYLAIQRSGPCDTPN